MFDNMCALSFKPDVAELLTISLEAWVANWQGIGIRFYWVEIFFLSVATKRMYAILGEH
jgi:hypothetical protein